MSCYVIIRWEANRPEFAVMLPSGRVSPLRFTTWDAANRHARSKRTV